MKKYNCYSLNISNKYDSYDKIRQLMYNIYRQMKRTIENDNRFKNISFIIGISNTDKESANETYICNGKRGRPKRVIEGVKLGEWHFHIYVFGNEEKLSTFCDVMKDKLKKSSENYIISKGGNNNPARAINYVFKQCDKRLKMGDYFKFTHLV